MATVYKINKGVNRPIEFKGLKGQWIGWLAAGLVFLLILFATLYLCGAHPVFCVALTLVTGTSLFMIIYRLNRKYGQHGLMKAIARRRMPKVIKVYTRKTFTNLCRKKLS